MNDMNGKWALVTGASSELEIEFATLLAERNANLILAARRTAPMEKLAEQLRQKHCVEIVVEGTDLSVPGAGAELKARLDKRGIAVDVLVNNAGFGLFGDFVSQPIQKILGMLQLNMLAVTELTHLFAADMVKRRTGHILLVASILGYEPTPGYAAYGASKGYVLLLGEALHAELKPHGVNVTVLSPGAGLDLFRSRVRPKGHSRASNANDGAQACGENRDCRLASTSFHRHSRSHEQARCFFFSVHSSADARPDHATSPVRLRRITARKTDWKSCPIERAAHFRHRHCPSVGPEIRNLWPQFKQNCALELLCEKRAREETPP